jgi:membrane protease YdiL (CAAX protease family)
MSAAHLPFVRYPYQRFVLFVLFAALALPLSGVLVGSVGLSNPEGAAWFGGAFTLALIGATVLLARLGREPLASLGFGVSGRQLRVVALAFVVAGSATAIALVLLGASSGARWQSNHAATPLTAIAGMLTTLSLFLSEELLFRGYAFQQLRRISGTPAAVALSAAAFGAYHLGGSGDWAIGAVYRFTMPALAGLVFGWALVRTGSIAVPVGLHWGANWVQSFILGIDQPLGAGTAVWVLPLAPDQARLLAAPDLLPHLPYLAALGLMLVFVRQVSRPHGLTRA